MEPISPMFVVGMLVMLPLFVFWMYKCYLLVEDGSIYAMAAPCLIHYPKKHKAVANAVSLVSRAEKKLEIYDNGNCYSTTVCNDTVFIGAIRDKLKEQENFHVICFFDYEDADQSFIEAFKGHARVQIHVRKYERPPRKNVENNTPYLIVDNGRQSIFLRKGPLGCHSTHEVIDCEFEEDRQLGIRARKLRIGKQQQTISDFRSIERYL